MLTTEALYREHWKYVYKLLPAYGIFGPSQEDVAQDVWCKVHERLPTYDPDQGTPRAWITGIVRNCAEHHRRRRSREHVGLEEDLREAAAASDTSAAELYYGGLRSRGPLSPEEQAMVYWMIWQALEDDNQFEALVLQQFFGYSIEEIATIQGATKSAVEWRIMMAKERLRKDGAPTKAFVGFGTLEALTEAMRPPEPPSARGEELWRRVSARIDPVSVPGPVPGLPAGAPARLLASKPVLAGLLGGVLLLSGEVGAAGMLACGPPSMAHIAPEPEPSLAIASLDGMAPGRPVLLPGTPAPAPADAITATTAGSSTSAAPQPTLGPRNAPPATEQTSDVDSGSSKRLILQMRAAANQGNCALVRTLLDEHARKFPNLDVAAREAERARCAPAPVWRVGP